MASLEKTQGDWGTVYRITQREKTYYVRGRDVSQIRVVRAAGDGPFAITVASAGVTEWVRIPGLSEKVARAIAETLLGTEGETWQ